MIKLYNDIKVKRFEYIYFFVMIIYMAQATGYTTRMIAGLTARPMFPFLLPIILTIILLDRNKISFSNNGLSMLITIMGIWTGCIIYKESLYSNQELSYYFFLFYAIYIAYIHVKVFGKKIFPLYEKIMVRMCFLTLILWIFAVLVPSSASFFRTFPKTGFGNSVFYIFTWMDPYSGSQVSNGIIRNAGFSWEPGRFSIMILLAIYCNLLRNGIKFRNNKEVIILLLSLASTQSTTGYVGAFVLFGIWGMKKISMNYILGVFLILLPIGYQLDFMKAKIEEQLDLDTSLKKFEDRLDYTYEQNQTDEYIASLGRFQAMYYEFQNIKEDPILGYGRSSVNSYFHTHISSNFVLTGGILGLFGQYGIPIGLFLYFMLYKSSKRIGREFNANKNALFVLFVLSLVSYSFFIVPIFTAFWFYGLFRSNEPITITEVPDNKDTESDKTNLLNDEREK